MRPAVCEPHELILSQLWLQLFRAVLDEVIDQFRSRIIHLHHEAIDFAGEIVEQPHRRHSYELSERCGEQGLRDAAGDRADTCRLGVLHAAERVDDSKHRSEQTHERGG